MMAIEYIPLQRFSDYYKAGWRLVPGHSLQHRDSMAMMMSPGHEATERRPTKNAAALSGAVTAAATREREAAA